jgi:hypothetical protein
VIFTGITNSVDTFQAHARAIVRMGFSGGLIEIRSPAPC